MSKNLTVIIALTLLLSACGLQILDPDWRALRKKLETQDIVIDRYGGEEVRIQGANGFYVTMKARVAKKMGAPNSVEFQEALEVQLQKERLAGNVYCPNGYILHFKMVYGNDATFLMNCN